MNQISNLSFSTSETMNYTLQRSSSCYGITRNKYQSLPLPSQLQTFFHNETDFTDQLCMLQQPFPHTVQLHNPGLITPIPRDYQPLKLDKTVLVIISLPPWTKPASLSLNLDSVFSFKLPVMSNSRFFFNFLQLLQSINDIIAISCSPRGW